MRATMMILTAWALTGCATGGGAGGGATDTSASAAVDPCELIAARQAEAVRAQRPMAGVPANELPARPYPAPDPTLAWDDAGGRCLRTSGGAAWGFVAEALVVGPSGYGGAPFAHEGEVSLVRVGPDGRASARAAGPFVSDGDNCVTWVSASLLTGGGGVIYEVRPECDEAMTEATFGIAVWRDGRVASPPSVARWAPLTWDGEPTRVTSLQVLATSLVGGLSGRLDVHFAIPLTVGADGEVSFDATARAALSTRCAPRPETSVDALWSGDRHEVIDAFGCDWVAGRSNAVALAAATERCAADSPPEREPDESDEDYEMTLDQWRMERPPLCELLPFIAVETSKPPPVRL